MDDERWMPEHVVSTDRGLMTAVLIPVSYFADLRWQPLSVVDRPAEPEYLSSEGCDDSLWDHTRPLESFPGRGWTEDRKARKRKAGQEKGKKNEEEEEELHEAEPAEPGLSGPLRAEASKTVVKQPASKKRKADGKENKSP